jgi:hypothetical protein
MRSCNPWRRWLLATIALLVLGLTWMPPAQASLHTYRERPGQVTVRSQQSLRDDSDRAWQAVAFKRWQQGQYQGTYLRLVGFPEVVTLDGDRPLALLAPTGQQWQLAPSLDSQTAQLPANAAQYNLEPLLGDLTAALPLDLQVPISEATPATLTLAPFQVQEWLQLRDRAVAEPKKT